MNKYDHGKKEIVVQIPGHVEELLDTLTKNGFEAYAVGGCVRDAILGRRPEDWDITTSALPMQIKGLFRRTVDTGIKHGTVTVLIDNIGYEVTTYRIDGDYEDYRHPKNVEFTASLAEDLKRRDFTINSMAYNPETGLVDLFGGLRDLENRVIKCVGNPEQRFSEDALRTLRAIRFCAQLNFTIEKRTKDAIAKMAPLIANISKERIQVELDKILVSMNPDEIKMAYETGITSYILPEFDLMMKTRQNSPYHKYSVGEHTLVVLKNVRADHYLRWAALLHDIGKPLVRTTDESGRDHFKGHGKKGTELAREILKRLRMDNRTIGIVTRLVEYHDYKIEKNESSVRRGIARVGEETFPYFIELCYADLSGKSEYAIQKNFDLLEYIKETYKRIIEEGNCITLSDLAVKGDDLIGMGLLPGKRIGEILNELLEMVLENPSLNDKNYLLDFVKKNFT